MLTRRSTRLQYILLPLLSVVLMGASQAYQQGKRCSEVRVQIENFSEYKFLETRDVEKLIGKDAQLLQTPRERIAIHRLEKRLYNTELVDSANLAFRPDGRLNVWLRQRQPIARFMGPRGISFYLDRELQHMPLSRNFSANTLLVRGACTKRVPGLDHARHVPHPALLPLLGHLADDTLLRNLLAELVIDQAGEIIFHPEFGHTRVRFGAPTRIPEKLNKLKRFYRAVAPRAGWQQYAEIDLRYRGQVVARRKLPNDNV